jgi:hypothetical protein
LYLSRFWYRERAQRCTLSCTNNNGRFGTLFCTQSEGKFCPFCSLWLIKKYMWTQSCTMSKPNFEPCFVP